MSANNQTRLANDNPVSRRKLTAIAGIMDARADAPSPAPLFSELNATDEFDLPPRGDQNFSLLSPTRLTALTFFGVSAMLTLMAMQVGLPARESGILAILSAVASFFVLKSLPHEQEVPRGFFSVAVAGFACLSALVLLPALNLWPAGSGPLVFSLVFAFIGTLIRSKACLAVAVAALFALMIDSDGLTRMRLDGQVATLVLFAIGLCGSVLAGSRIIAGITLVGVMAAALTLLASFGVPATGALSIIAIFAAATAIALRAYHLQGYGAAELPMVLSALVFAAAAIALQLHLLGEITGQSVRLGEPMPRLGVVVLIAIQCMVLFISAVSWFAGRINLIDAVLLQAIFGLICTVIIDPTRLSRLGGGDPSLLLAGIVCLVVGGLAGLVLYRSWQADRPILTALSALIVMIECIFVFRIAMGTFDIALAALICAGLAVALAVLMALNPRRIAHSRLS
ncbi:MAG: hypothetical protein AAF311_11585 [Pseudomonadota bacterium]